MKKAKLKIVSVVGARPNFMKIAPFIRALRERADRFEHRLVHTGQHYDRTMSGAFFKELKIPAPDIDLGVGSGTHAEQVGRTMIEFEKVLRRGSRPDWVVVVGDVNATMACAIAAKKEHIKLAHIEAGLRSFDMDMPEEVNRIVTDRLADLLFTTDALADGNLRREGVVPARIKRVGNIMIDTLESQRTAAADLDPEKIAAAGLIAAGGGAAVPPLPDRGYAVVTLHRPNNVDQPETLGKLVVFFTREVAPRMPVVWPVHPRTFKQLERLRLLGRLRACRAMALLEPLGYREMLRLNMGARVMFTDSGGLQEECCVLGTPCLTLRNATERPVTLREYGGMSTLVGNDVAVIRKALRGALRWPRAGKRPPLWDGRTAGRIAAILARNG